MKDVLLILGTGGSVGIPMLGCTCSVCRSKNSKDKRLRSGAVFKVNGKNILIDAGPDIRQQCIENEIDHIDALFLTHYHEDHVGGINDLRGFFIKRKHNPIPVYLSESTYEMLVIRFAYLLDRFSFHIIYDHMGTINIFDTAFAYCCYMQGTVPVLGFRYKNAAYFTDIKYYDDSIFPFLEEVSDLVIGALDLEGSHMHFSVQEASEFGKKAKVKNTYLIHMNHKIEHEVVTKTLREGLYLAVDGMVINV